MQCGKTDETGANIGCNQRKVNRYWNVPLFSRLISTVIYRSTWSVERGWKGGLQFLFFFPTHFFSKKKEGRSRLIFLSREKKRIKKSCPFQKCKNKKINSPNSSDPRHQVRSLLFFFVLIHSIFFALFKAGHSGRPNLGLRSINSAHRLIFYFCPLPLEKDGHFLVAFRLGSTVSKRKSVFFVSFLCSPFDGSRSLLFLVAGYKTIKNRRPDLSSKKKKRKRKKKRATNTQNVDTWTHLSSDEHEEGCTRIFLSFWVWDIYFFPLIFFLFRFLQRPPVFGLIGPT